MENKSVSDTGPIIHLSEVELMKSLKIVKEVLIPPEVKEELKNYKIKLSNNIRETRLDPNNKNLSEFISNEYSIDLGEAEAISLAIQEKINLFFTDDLDARSVAKNYNLEPHGTAGIILRAFRDKVIDKRTAITKIEELHTKSSLFITKELTNYIIRAIDEFKK